MTKTRTASFAAIFAVLALLVMFAVCLLHPSPHQFVVWVFKYGGLLAFGTVTSTYNFFQAGILQSGTTPPTLAQAQNEGMLNVQLNWADADTTATLTHNWNFSAAEQTALLPIVDIFPTQSNTQTTVVAVTAQGTNSVTVGKGANAGSGGTYVIQMLRPNSLIR
jgi:hypothetical protein